MEDPLYQHDCPRCTYLGKSKREGVYADLYHCVQFGAIPTIIARYSDRPSDYASGIPFKDTHPHLKEAYRRAEERGLQLEIQA